MDTCLIALLNESTFSTIGKVAIIVQILAQKQRRFTEGFRLPLHFDD